MDRIPYSLGGLAAALAVSPTTVRRLEAEGVVPRALRLHGSDRRLFWLDATDLETIRAGLAERRQRNRKAVAMAQT